MCQKFVRESRRVGKSQLFCIHGNIKEDDGNITDKPTIGAVVEVKEGECAILIHEEVILMGILVDKTVGGVVLGQHVNMFKHRPIVLMNNDFGGGQIFLNKLQADI